MITPIELANKHRGTIRHLTRLFVILLMLLVALFSFTLVIDALFEVGSHLAAVYQSSDSIFRLIMWLVAAYLLKKMAPYAVRLFERF